MLTSRHVWLMLHLGCAVLFIHGGAGGIATLLQREKLMSSTARHGTWAYTITRIKDVVRTYSSVSLALIAWLTVLTGTWLVLPGYRAEPPPGANIAAYPKAALLASQSFSFWHNFGAEWKEHVGWLMPFLSTAVAFIVLRHPDLLNQDERLRKAVAVCFVTIFAVAVVAAGLGAIINNVAPNDFLKL